MDAQEFIQKYPSLIPRTNRYYFEKGLEAGWERKPYKNPYKDPERIFFKFWHSGFRTGQYLRDKYRSDRIKAEKVIKKFLKEAGNE